MFTLDSQKMKQAMQEADLSVAEIARRSGLSRFGIFKILSGERRDPSISTVAAIAHTIGVRIETLLSDASSLQN